MLLGAGTGTMSCFWTNSHATAPAIEPVSAKTHDVKAARPVEEVAHKEDAGTAREHKSKSTTGGSQAHGFVRHLIHDAVAR